MRCILASHWIWVWQFKFFTFLIIIILTPYGVICLRKHWFRQWLVACSALTQCLNQCWHIANCTPATNHQYNEKRDINNSFLNIHLNMPSINVNRYAQASMCSLYSYAAQNHPSPYATLQWRHNERDGVSNHRRPQRLFTCWNIKAPRHWPLCGDFTGDRWIPRTKGQ